MENNGNVICRAKFKTNIIANIIKGLVVFLIPCIIFTVLNHRKMEDDAVSGMIRSLENKKVSYEYHKGIMRESLEIENTKKLDLKRLEYDGFESTATDNDGIPTKSEKYYFFGASNKASKPLSIIYIILIAGLGLCVAVLPIIQSKRCSFDLSEEQISGQLKTTFGKKRLQIPIDHLDNVMTSNGLIDKIRGGETLLISSNSGLIRFHYVQNAEDFAQAAMKRINEVKKSAPQSAPAPVPVQNISGGGAMEKINSLKQMLENGLITQEDFDSKKADILSKM